MSYSGAAIAAVHAGDLFTLFVWWEATAFTSVFLIIATKTQRSYKSAFRYILIQVGSGMFLLAGAILLIALAIVVMRFRHSSKLGLSKKNK